jgi:hypothetical protein
LNVALTLSLRGHGTSDVILTVVILTVDGQNSNAVSITVQ